MTAPDLTELRGEWARLKRNAELTHARMLLSQHSIRRSLQLLQESAKHMRPPDGDPGRQAAALGSSLARAAMRRRVP